MNTLRLRQAGLITILLFSQHSQAADEFDIYSVNPADYAPMPVQEPRQVPIPRDNTAPQGAAVIYDIPTGTHIRLEPQPRKLKDTGPIGPTESNPGAEHEHGVDAQGSRKTFSPLEVVDSRTSYPQRTMVKILFSNGSGDFSCSGTLTSRNIVLTAGHCVYDFDNSQTARNFVVIPAFDYYSDNPEPYGRAGASRLLWWEDYAKKRDNSYDIGLIRLTSAIGNLTGWLGMNENASCSFLTGNTFHQFSYPGEEFQSREMYYRYGLFDSCINFIGTSNPYLMARINSRGIHGQSGSSAYHINGNDERHAYAVHSTGSNSSSNFARINNSQLDQIISFMNSATPKEKADSLFLCGLKVYPYWFYGEQQRSDADFYYRDYASGWSVAVGKDGTSFWYIEPPATEYISADIDAINQHYCAPYGYGY